MAFGFPAYFTDSQRHSASPHVLILAVKETLNFLGWKYEMVSPERLEAQIPADLYSWGERLSIVTSFDGTVTAKSSCLLRTQCFDWGKNRRNLEIFFDKLSRTMADHQSTRSPNGSQEQSSPQGHKPLTAPFDERAKTPIQRLFDEDEEK